MKDKIKYEYHIDVDSLIEKKDYCMFRKNNDYYYFTKIKRNEKEIEEIIKMYEELKSKNYPVSTIVKTVNNNLFVMINDTPYILICVNKPMEEYSLLDMIKIWDKLPINIHESLLTRENWGSLWSEKIDYFEYQIRELGKNKKIVLNTFGYFVGLAENAISYVNKVNERIKPDRKQISLCHHRVWFPNYHLNYDNPLQFVIDLEVRDVAEYLKGEALDNIDLSLADLKAYLNIRKPDLYSLSMLYARLLYPSYYFDLYENVMNDDTNEERLIKIMDKVHEIEKFLKKSYDLIILYGPIEPVEWIIKKEL